MASLSVPSQCPLNNQALCYPLIALPFLNQRWPYRFVYPMLPDCLNFSQLNTDKSKGISFSSYLTSSRVQPSSSRMLSPATCSASDIKNLKPNSKPHFQVIIRTPRLSLHSFLSVSEHGFIRLLYYCPSLTSMAIPCSMYHSQPH